MSQWMTAWTAAFLATLFAGIAKAAPIMEIELNDSIAGAQNIDNAFSLTFDINIENSAADNTSSVVPHAEVQGTGNNTVDYFSFTAAAGANLILDIDCGSTDQDTCNAPDPIDAWIEQYYPNGVLLAKNDDSLVSDDTGSAVSDVGLLHRN